MKQLTRTKKITVCSVSVILLVLGIIAYIAADRFLIEHVEVDLGDITDVSQTKPLNDLNTSETEHTSANANVFENELEEIIITDMSYISSSKTILISKMTLQNDEKNLVYFIADVVLDNGTQLRSAFAKNKFGTNIIDFVSKIAETNDAIFAVNGDYYGFRNNGVIIRNGILYRNIPMREGLAIYNDGSMKVYDEKEETAEELLADGVWNTLSFGPALLENGEIISGIENIEVDTNFGNRTIQGYQPRTGIGIVEINHFIFIVADGRNPGYSDGVTMTQFAEIFKDLGCNTAYNLDGGGSAEMWFMGNVVNIPCNSNGSERGTSDILYIS